MTTVRKSIFSLSFIAALVLVLVGCDQSPQQATTEQNEAGSEDVEAVTQVHPDDVTTYDERMLRINQEVEGFAGVYEQDDRYVVLSTNTASKTKGNLPRIQNLIAEEVGFDFTRKSVSTAVAPAEYDFRELMDAKDRARRLLSRDNVSYVDINERENRVAVGVTQNASEIRSAVSDDARITVESAKKVEFLQSLRDDYTGTFKQGGLEIGFRDGFTTYPCTKSTTTKYYDGAYTEYGFLTNSHCTAVQGGVEGTQYYQDAQDESEVVGVELHDPAYFTGNGCPSGQKCRYSDAAFVDYRVSGFDYGGIHLTNGRDRYNGSTEISGEVDVSEPGGAGVGTEVDKVGKKTGWTYGDVTDTCVDVRVGNITILCQHEVNAGAGKGDSGSPVFRSTGGGVPSDGDRVKYLGILWGGISADNIYYYSPHSQIEDELPKGYRVQD